MAVCLSASCAAIPEIDGQNEEPPSHDSLNSGESGQVDEPWTSIELAVLYALMDDPRPKSARYEPDENRVVVTFHTLGRDLSDEDIQRFERAAESAIGGIEVVIKPTDDDPPDENDGWSYASEPVLRSTSYGSR
jgi:hypothetical protein